MNPLLLARWLALAFAAWALIGLFYVLVGFSLHYADARRRGLAPGSLGTYLRTALFETAATLTTWALYPLGWLPARRVARPDPSAGPPVVLVHGYMMNRTSLALLERGLRRNGLVNVYHLEPRPLFAPLEEQGEHLAAELRRLSGELNGARIVAIGHSQGGLLLRLCTVRYPDLPLSKIITIGTPHRGTRMARFMRSPNAVQMRIGSTFLAQLAEATPVPLVSYYSEFDNIAFPADASVLGKAVRTSPMGHHVLVMSPEMIREVAAEIRREAPAAQP